MKNKKSRLIQGPLMYLLLLAVILGVVWMMGTDSAINSLTLNYSEFLTWVENDLHAAEGKVLTGDAADQTISSIVIQENVLYGRREGSLITDVEFPASYDFKVVLPSVTQFYTDVNRIYEK